MGDLSWFYIFCLGPLIALLPNTFKLHVCGFEIFRYWADLMTLIPDTQQTWYLRFLYHTYWCVRLPIIFISWQEPNARKYRTLFLRCWVQSLHNWRSQVMRDKRNTQCDLMTRCIVKWTPAVCKLTCCLHVKDKLEQFIISEVSNGLSTWSVDSQLKEKIIWTYQSNSFCSYGSLSLASGHSHIFFMPWYSSKVVLIHIALSSNFSLISIVCEKKSDHVVKCLLHTQLWTSFFDYIYDLSAGIMIHTAVVYNYYNLYNKFIYLFYRSVHC